MQRNDFMKLIGAESGKHDYLPVAVLLRSGYACAGYYNRSVNEDLATACVLLNAHLIEFQGPSSPSGRPSINDFNEFLEEIVVNFASGDGPVESSREGLYGNTVPLMALAYDEITVVYPVAHIGALMQRVKDQERSLPTFLDLNKSEIINLLRIRLW